MTRKVSAWAATSTDVTSEVRSFFRSTCSGPPSPSTSTIPAARVAVARDGEQFGGRGAHARRQREPDRRVAIRPSTGSGSGAVVAEALVVGAVVEVVAVQGLEVVEGGVDIAAPHLLRKVVEHFEAVAVGIGDVGGMTHAVVAADDELDPVGLHVAELVEPRLPVGIADGDVVHADACCGSIDQRSGGPACSGSVTCTSARSWWRDASPR